MQQVAGLQPPGREADVTDEDGQQVSWQREEARVRSEVIRSKLRATAERLQG